MSNDINWANLVANGRANAIGVPWTDEQALARAAGVPAEYVREGILTLEGFQEKKSEEDGTVAAGGEKPLNKMKLDELKEKATELGLEFTPSVTKAALIEIINNKLNEEVAPKDDDSESKEDVE